MRAILSLCICAAIGLLLGTCDKSPTDSTDRIPPARINSLNVTDSTATSATVYWRAVGDDSLTGTASAYDMRISTTILTETNWPGATVIPQHIPPGSQGIIEHFTIAGLDSTRGYYIAIKAIDDAGNTSALSNVVTVNVPDTVPPARVADLWCRQVGDTALWVGWTAPGSDSLTGKAGYYDLRYSKEQLTQDSWPQAIPFEQNLVPQLAGMRESVLVRWPTPETLLYVGLKTFDVTGNLSSLSNVVMLSWLPPINVAWELVYSALPGLTPVSIAVTSDGGFVIASNKVQYSNPTCSIVITKIDSGGQRQWEQTFSNGKYDDAAKVLALADGRIAVIGTTTSFADSTGDVYFLELSSDGSKLSDRAIDLGAAQRANGASIYPDGGFIVAGCVRGVSTRAPNVVRIDADGNVIWNAVQLSCCSCPWEPLDVCAVAFDVAVGGTGLITVSITDYSYWQSVNLERCWIDRSDVLLQGFSSDSCTLWGNLIDDDLYAGASAGHVLAIADGDCLAASATAVGIKLSRVSSSGTVKWQLPLVGYVCCQQVALGQLVGNLFAVAGRSLSTPKGEEYSAERLDVRIIDGNGLVIHELALNGIQCAMATTDDSTIVLLLQRGNPAQAVVEKLRLTR